MKPIIANGIKVADVIQAQVATRIAMLRSQNSELKAPRLAIILTGDNPASASYVNRKILVSNQIGIQTELHHFPYDVSLRELEMRIESLNCDPKVDGILVQIPLPSNINRFQIINKIDHKKDVDCLHSVNLQKLLINGELQDTLPCTPAGVMTLLDYYQVDVRGMNTTVIGRSHLVGYPLSILLMMRNSTVTICHKQTQDLRRHVQNADLVISAAGVRHLVKGDWIKEGAVVVDVGINMALPQDGSKIVGDVEFDKALPRCSLITPVPRGIGPMTIARLMVNLQNIWCYRNNISIPQPILPKGYLQD